jgi:hypothetical protein
MTDFWENVNEGIEDNAGLLGAAVGLAALKGQQAQKEKLSAIEAQLQKAESRVEKEAQLKRKLVALEEYFEDVEKTLEDQKSHFLVAAQNNFNFTLFRDQVGGACDQLSSIEDIKYAKSIEKKAEKLDDILKPICVFFKSERLDDSLVGAFYDRVEGELETSAVDYALDNSEKHNPFSSIIKEWGDGVLMEIAAKVASDKGISLEPHINISNVSEVFSNIVFGENDRNFISALKNKNGAEIDRSHCVSFSVSFSSPNFLNRRGILAREVKALSRPHNSDKELLETIKESRYFSYLASQLEIERKSQEERDSINRVFLCVCFSIIIIVLSIVYVTSSV